MWDGTFVGDVASGRLRLSVVVSPTGFVAELPAPTCNWSSPARSCEDAHALLCVLSTTLSVASAMFVFSSRASLKLRRRGNWEVLRVLVVVFCFFLGQPTHQLCNSSRLNNITKPAERFNDQLDP